MKSFSRCYQRDRVATFNAIYVWLTQISDDICNKQETLKIHDINIEHQPQ